MTVSRRCAFVLATLWFAGSLVSRGRSETIPVQSLPMPQATARTVAAPATDPEVSRAFALFQKRDYDGALKLLTATSARNPDVPPAQVVLYQWFAQSNQPASARASLDWAVSANPDDPESYVILGDLALADRRITEAELLFGKAQELLPGFRGSARRKGILQARATGGLAAAAEARQQWDLAQSHLEALLKLTPGDAPAMQRLAQVMFQQKNPQGALEKFRQAAKADPRGTLTAEAALALCYERHGDHAQAVKWMAQAVKAAREDLRTRLTAAQWALDTEQVAEARNSAEEALRIDPKSTDARLLRGAVALFQKDYAEAEKQYEAAHLQSPASFVASNNLAAALCEQNDESKKRRALAWAESNFQQNPRSREAAATLGRVLYQVGQLNRAEESLRLATQGGNATSDTAYYLARVLLDRGRKDEAKIWLDAAVKAKGPFAMRPEATELLGKLKSGPPKK